MNEIEKMNIEEVETRASEIKAEAEEATEERLSEIKAEAEALEARKAELKKMAEEAQEVRNAVAEESVHVEKIQEIKTEERKMTNKEICQSAEYRAAFKNYILTGKDEECRALLTENVNGDVPVPEMVYDVVKNAWEKEGIVALVKKTYIKGNLKVAFEISADGAFVHTEGAAVNTSTQAENLVLGTVNIVAANIKKFIYISDEVIEGTPEAFLQYVYDEITYQIAKKLADLIISKIAACGTVSTNTPSVNVAVPKITEASIALNTIANALAQLSDQASNPVILMNKATFASFKSVQAAGSYGYDPFEGLKVYFNNSITAFSAATTGVAYCYVGDLGEAVIANFPDGEGIKLKYDDLSLAEQDLVKIIGRQYVGVEVVGPQAICKIVK
jgi:HK97 family phage major capsid protein